MQKVPTEGAVEALKRAVVHMDKEDLSVLREDFTKLVLISIHSGPFIFEGSIFNTVAWLWDPPSVAGVSLIMETKEKDHYEQLMGPRTTQWMYVNDVINITPKWKLNTACNIKE